MKFLTTVSCESEFAPSAAFALIDINSDNAALLKQFRAHADTMAIAESLCGFNYIAAFDCSADWFGNPPDEDDEVQDIYDYIRSRVNLCAPNWHNFNLGGAITVPDDFELPEEYLQRVDMAQVRVRACGFHYASMADGSDCYQTSADICFGELG